MFKFENTTSGFNHFKFDIFKLLTTVNLSKTANCKFQISNSPDAPRNAKPRAVASDSASWFEILTALFFWYILLIKGFPISTDMPKFFERKSGRFFKLAPPPHRIIFSILVSEEKYSNEEWLW